MNRHLLLMLALIILTSTGCSKTQISFRYNQPFDYASLKTYSFKAAPQHSAETSLHTSTTPQVIQQTVNSLLTAKGYNIAKQSDFVVSYHYSRKNRPNRRNILSRIGVGIGSFGRYCGIESSRWFKQSDRSQAQLVIKIIDTRQGTTFWKGTSTGRLLSSHSNQAEKERYVQVMVEKILNNFPATIKKVQYAKLASRTTSSDFLKDFF